MKVQFTYDAKVHWFFLLQGSKHTYLHTLWYLSHEVLKWEINLQFIDCEIQISLYVGKYGELLSLLFLMKVTYWQRKRRCHVTSWWKTGWILHCVQIPVAMAGSNCCLYATWETPKSSRCIRFWKRSYRLCGGQMQNDG